MRQVDLLDLFSDIYGCCAIEKIRHSVYDRNQAKAEIFKRLLESYSYDASQFVIYDDTWEHLDAARRLGMDTVSVSNEHAGIKEPRQL